MKHFKINIKQFFKGNFILKIFLSQKKKNLRLGEKFFFLFNIINNNYLKNIKKKKKKKY
jgi:hypothetical protein